MYIKDRYPLMGKNSTLVARLGEANARRRQNFLYRRDHDEHLSTVATKGDPENVKAQASVSVERGAENQTELTPATEPSLFVDPRGDCFEGKSFLTSPSTSSHDDEKWRKRACTCGWIMKAYEYLSPDRLLTAKFPLVPLTYNSKS